MHWTTIIKPGFWNAWVYMSVFIIQMLVIISGSEKVRKRSHLPPDINRNRRDKFTPVIANIVWLIALIYSIFLPLKPGTIWFCIGFFMFLIGLIILTLATYYFIVIPPDQIIRKGVYRFSRHPMYLSTFLICMGAGISSCSWIFLILTAVMIFCFHQEALAEERYCLQKYGHTYQDYIKSVPRWIGIPGRMKR
jgi:protein-S-isoprenylcysteine O-methyltransferase Ste14